MEHVGYSTGQYNNGAVRKQLRPKKGSEGDRLKEETDEDGSWRRKQCPIDQ
jgi:hypothetical protein